MDPDTLAFTVLLGTLGALPPLSIDMALPALSLIATTLHRSLPDVTLTLSLFMAGFATAQLFFGPLSDRFGRRPILIAGCALFSVASGVCAFASSLEMLLAARFVEGCGAGAGMVMVFAMVRDLFAGPAGRTKLSFVNIVLNVAPMIAPALGAGILFVLPWQAIYGVLGVGGAVLTLVLWFGLDETLKHPAPDALNAVRIVMNYAQVMRTRLCIGYILVNGLSFGCMFAYVTGSSFLMIQLLGLSATGYAITFACTALGIIGGSHLCGLLSKRRVAAVWPLTLGLAGTLLHSVGLLTLTLSGNIRLELLLPALVGCTFSFGLVTPNAAHGAMHALPRNAGVTGAALGFFQIALGSAGSALVAELSDGSTILSMSAVMAAFAAAAMLAYFWLVRPAERREGEDDLDEGNRPALAGVPD